MNVAAAPMTKTHDLRQLLLGIADAPRVAIHGICDDSRNVVDGDLFVALQGDTSHGLEYADAAVQAGAAAVIWDSSTGQSVVEERSVPFVAVEDLSVRVGEVANRWFGQPSRSLDVFGVTGTNGKTTVAYLIAQCLQNLGQQCGYIGTLGHGIHELTIDLGLTTPPCLALHGELAEMQADGATQAAIEVSSHALSQDRLAGMHFDAAIFTNLSRDHVDYHGDMESYGASKARLFTDFDCTHRIISFDSEFGRQLASRCEGGVIATSALSSHSTKGHQHVVVRSAVANANGSSVRVTSSWGDGEVRIPMPGDFNISNAIEVLALLLAKGIEFDDAREAIAQISAPPGRMQSVHASGDQSLPQVYVDYAHTPAALEAALQALRAHTIGDLWCVFGCGGERDRGKRPLMGTVVQQLADCAIVTNDNPRGEAPAKIIDDVLGAMDASALAIEDRAAAIAYAIQHAAPEDTVLIAGKGHENYQIVGDERRDFSDFHAARANMHIRHRGRSTE